MTVQRRLFRFGFETPHDARLNYEQGTDFESSTCLWIASESDEEALEWGRAIAADYSSWLFREVPAQTPWVAGWNHACWIEDDPTILKSVTEIQSIPAVRIGEMPNFQALDPLAHGDVRS